jgi:invasion protein IalB
MLGRAKCGTLKAHNPDLSRQQPRRSSMKPVFVLLSVITAGLCYVGSNTVAAGDPRASQLTYEPWRKLCLHNSDCYTGVDARGACHPSGGGVAIVASRNQVFRLSASFATARVIDGPISVIVDQREPILIQHLQCYAQACAGSFEIDGAFIEGLKHSQTVAIETMATQEKLRLSFSLAGFAQAYDGPEAETKVFEEPWHELKEDLQQRADTNPACE